MKLQCDLCREIVVADFAVTADGIEVRCPACDRTFVVRATRGAPGDAPAPPPVVRVHLKAPTLPPPEAVPVPLPSPSPSGAIPVAIAASPSGAVRRAPAPGEPAMTCPKCGDAQPVAVACRSCGLLASKMKSFAQDERPVPPEVQTAWANVESRWSDPAAHEAFQGIVATTTSYAWAARKYRERSRQAPADPVASEQLARLTRAAEATLFASASPRPGGAKKSYRGATIALIAIIALGVVGVGYAMLSTGLHPASEADDTTLPPPPPGPTGSDPPATAIPPSNTPPPPGGAPAPADPR